MNARSAPPPTAAGFSSESFVGAHLPQQMDAVDATEWSVHLATAVGAMPGRDRGKKARLGRACGAIRASLYDHSERHDGAPIKPGHVGRWLAGENGANPDMTFVIGEGLYETGVPWCSGALVLSWSRTYLPHVVGLVGHLLRSGPTDDLRGMWDGLRLAMVPIATSYSETSARRLSWSDDQHRMLRTAWKSWRRSLEERSEMPDVFRQYLALCRLHTSTQEGHDVRHYAEHAVARWMESATKRWERYGRWFREPEPTPYDRVIGARWDGLSPAEQDRLLATTAGPSWEPTATDEAYIRSLTESES